MTKPKLRSVVLWVVLWASALLSGNALALSISQHALLSGSALALSINQHVPVQSMPGSGTGAGTGNGSGPGTGTMPPPAPGDDTPNPGSVARQPGMDDELVFID